MIVLIYVFLKYTDAIKSSYTKFWPMYLANVMYEIINDLHLIQKTSG